MSHIKALQEKVCEGRSSSICPRRCSPSRRVRRGKRRRGLSFIATRRRRSGRSPRMRARCQQLSRAGIDPGRELVDRMRNRPKALTDASPRAESPAAGERRGLCLRRLRRFSKSCWTPRRTSQLMAEIMQETVEVEDGDGERGAGVAEERDRLAQAASGRGGVMRLFDWLKREN